MAIGRPQMGNIAAGVKAALIAFVCLTVASLGITIWLYTQQEDLRAAADAAQTKAGQAAQRERATLQQLSDIARDVIGNPTEQPAEIKQGIKTALAPILKDERVKQANIPEDSAVLTALQGLHQALRTDADALAAATKERNDLKAQLAAATETAKAAQQGFADKTAELEKRFQELEQKNAADQQAWSQQLEQLTQQVAKGGEDANRQLNAVREAKRQDEEKIKTLQARIDELVETLAKNRPSADRLSLLQSKDGDVVRAVAGEDLCYIDLGRRDALKTGMTFAVYSRIRGIPEDGKGKASISVVNVFETTSECRITSSTKGDPVLEGDVVANPVYDRSHKLTFAVAGDFDLDFDGKIDDPGGEQVTQLIRSSGGQVVDKIDTRTDFVVLGAPPPMAAKPDEGDDAQAKARAAQRQAAHDAFEAAKQEAKALSIPVLTRTQFLHFVGFGVARDKPDDPPGL